MAHYRYLPHGARWRTIAQETCCCRIKKIFTIRGSIRYYLVIRRVGIESIRFLKKNKGEFIWPRSMRFSS